MQTAFQNELVCSYDHMFFALRHYLDGRDGSGFANLGYFEPGVSDLALASESLVRRLWALRRGAGGRVLDVGCGLGATVAYLGRTLPPEQIHGINISAAQLDECRQRAPHSHFHLMPAERMTFPDACFDTVITVEAALHFQGRREFLREARRVLKPGGVLLAADLLFDAEPQVFRRILAGQETYAGGEEYAALWQDCGFADIEWQDITVPSWQGFVAHTRQRALRELLQKRIDGAMFKRLLVFADDIAAMPVSAYLLARGVKPVAEPV